MTGHVPWHSPPLHTVTGAGRFAPSPSADLHLGNLRTAALAEAHGLPVVSHLAPEIQVHLLPAIPNGLTVEFMPWSVAMFEEVPWPRAGMLELPQGPGLGLRVDRRAIEQYRT